MLEAQYDQEKAKVTAIRDYLDKIYNSSGRKEDLDSFSDKEILEMAANLVGGVPMATPVFDARAKKNSHHVKAGWFARTRQITL